MKILKNHLLPAAVFSFLTFFMTVYQYTAADSVPLEKIKLPEGFMINIFAIGLKEPRSMTMSPGGTLFVGTRKTGRVYAVIDSDNDFSADKVYIIDRNMNMPNGVAFKDGSLFVAEVDRILRYDDIETDLKNPPDPVVINDSYPGKYRAGY